MTPTELDTAIQDALVGNVKPARAAEIVALAKRRLSELETATRAATERSLDPETSAQAAAAAKTEAADAKFAHERLSAAIAALEARIEQRRAADAEAAKTTERAAAIAERDALAREIAEVYPALTAQLTDLFGRINANDERLRAVAPGDVSAETVARGSLGNGQWGADKGLGPVMRLTKIKLPLLHRQGLLWPEVVSRPGNFGSMAA